MRFGWLEYKWKEIKEQIHQCWTHFVLFIVNCHFMLLLNHYISLPIDCIINQLTNQCISTHFIANQTIAENRKHTCCSISIILWYYIIYYDSFNVNNFVNKLSTYSMFTLYHYQSENNRLMSSDGFLQIIIWFTFTLSIGSL